MRIPVLATLTVIGLLAACAPPATTPSPSTVPSAWPSGVPTLAPPRAAPSVGTATPDTGKLQISFAWPHLLFTTSGVPAGTYSVIYVVVPVRENDEQLQIDATDSQADFLAKLEYMRLRAGDYEVRGFIKGTTTPFETRLIRVP